MDLFKSLARTIWGGGSAGDAAPEVGSGRLVFTAAGAGAAVERYTHGDQLKHLGPHPGLTAGPARIALCWRRFAEATMKVVPVDKQTGSYNLVITRASDPDDDGDDPDKLCTAPSAPPPCPSSTAPGG